MDRIEIIKRLDSIRSGIALDLHSTYDFQDRRYFESQYDIISRAVQEIRYLEAKCKYCNKKQDIQELNLFECNQKEEYEYLVCQDCIKSGAYLK